MNPRAVHTRSKVIIRSWFPIPKHCYHVPGRRVLFKKKGRGWWEKYFPFLVLRRWAIKWLGSWWLWISKDWFRPCKDTFLDSTQNLHGAFNRKVEAVWINQFYKSCEKQKQHSVMEAHQEHLNETSPQRWLKVKSLQMACSSISCSWTPARWKQSKMAKQHTRH